MPSALPALDQAIAKETDAAVKRALIEARAAVVLYSTDATEADKLDADRAIRERGDQDALGAARRTCRRAPRRRQERAATPSPRSRTASPIWTAVQNAWYGLSLGSVLLLAAIGLAITFGVMGVINMAHGEMVMLGAYTTFVVQEVIRTQQSRRCSTIRWPSPFRSPSWSPAWSAS